MTMALDLRTVTAQDFAPHLGSTFTIVAGNERREIRLERAEEQGHLMEGATKPDGTPFFARTPFSLVFTGPSDELFGQATFEVHHETLGMLTLFIKPYGEQDETIYYESIFS